MESVSFRFKATISRINLRIDIDWEYPGGNGADYRQVPNSEKAYQIDAFPKVLAAIRTAIGEDKLLSIAVPGKKGDMIAFTQENSPKIWPSVDYINVSTGYERHHSFLDHDRLIWDR